MILELLFLLVSVNDAAQNALRVYQGQMDLQNEFPFAVLLQMEQQPFLRVCSGSLVAARWVLTAGHCIGLSPRLPPFVIKYQNFTEPMSNAYSKPIIIIVHPNYVLNANLGLVSNDIALIFTERIPKSQGKLSALDYKTLFGLSVKYAGFGLTSENIDPSLNRHLKQRAIPLQVGEGLVITCDKNQFKYGPAVCIVPKCSRRTQNARPGDSGGPLLYNGKIIGVATSITTGPIVRAYYTPVSPYLSWIKQMMQYEQKINQTSSLTAKTIKC